ncbi:hypothetical protein FO519_000418 [Halicephalobus sp. NKZ332]|nr:hypothetical protein FO519_000418 [Halicephalobus sp. NKZ332]
MHFSVRLVRFFLRRYFQTPPGMLISRHSTFVFRRFVSAAPPTTTGIEHALKAKQVGRSHKQDFKDYKCIDYLNYNKYSFYDLENKVNPSRVPQPTNKKPDVMPQYFTSNGNDDIGYFKDSVRYLKENGINSFNNEIEYFGDIAQEIYFWVTAVIFGATFLTSASVIYIILNYSTPSLKVYKWYMLNSIILTYVNATNLFLLQPIPLYPNFIFIVNGPVKYLTLKFLVFYQPFALGSAFLVSTAITLRFYYRYIKVCTNSWFYYALSSRWKSLLIVVTFLLLISSCFTGPLTCFQLPPRQVNVDLSLIFKSNSSNANEFLAGPQIRKEILIGYDINYYLFYHEKLPNYEIQKSPKQSS